MGKGVKRSVLNQFLKKTKILESAEKERDDFVSDEAFEFYKFTLVEGSKNLLMQNDGDLDKSFKSLKDKGFDFDK